MADLETPSDLKAKFGHFDDLVNLISTMQGTLQRIAGANSQAVGDDEIGKQYHKTVDQPTQDLTGLMQDVSNTVNMTGQAGQDTSDGFANADEAGTDVVNRINQS